VASFKGDFDNNNDLKDAFSTLFVNDKDNSNSKEKEQHLDLYFTLIENLLIKLATSYTSSLYTKVLLQELNN
jgi:putative alpha-1,2-mannosidase